MHADDSEQHADFAADEPEVRPYLFEQMLSIAGILHIIDTVTKQLHSGIKDWDTFTAHLFSIVALLCYEGPRQVFVWRCLKGGGYNDYVVHFDKTFDAPTDNRWTSLTFAVKWLLPLQMMLTDAWLKPL